MVTTTSNIEIGSDFRFKFAFTSVKSVCLMRLLVSVAMFASEIQKRSNVLHDSPGLSHRFAPGKYTIRECYRCIPGHKPREACTTLERSCISSVHTIFNWIGSRTKLLRLVWWDFLDCTDNIWITWHFFRSNSSDLYMSKSMLVQHCWIYVARSQNKEISSKIGVMETTRAKIKWENV